MQSRNSFDNIVVSFLLGLSAVTIYSNYFYIVNALHGVFSVLIASTASSIGNSIATETKEKNFNDFFTVQTIYSWVSSMGNFLHLYSVSGFYESLGR